MSGLSILRSSSLLLRRTGVATSAEQARMNPEEMVICGVRQTQSSGAQFTAILPYPSDTSPPPNKRWLIRLKSAFQSANPLRPGFFLTYS
jgi:hypothetical protein